MLKKMTLSLGLVIALLVPGLGHYVFPNTRATMKASESNCQDRVVTCSCAKPPVHFTQYKEPPASPCTVVSYAACNYFVPANDYVTFPLANDISFASCPADDVSTATITFQATPNVPLFVWLSNDTSSTTPVYMTGASQTITKAWFGAGATSWFGGGPWTKLNVQAIYPSPPPDTFYYPISFTIVYQ